MLVLAILALSLATATQNPCALANQSSIEMILGGPTVPVPASEMGEETAPYCLWATSGRANEVKLSIWSSDELPVLNMPDAATYFAKLHAEAVEGGRVLPLAGLGERAFASDLHPKASGKADGSIMVLKQGRVIVFDFTNITSRDAQAFAAQIVSRM